MALKEKIIDKNNKTQAPPAKAPASSNPLRFKPGVQYEFGELTKGSPTNAPDWRVKPTVRSGKHFIELGCRSIGDYLENNPENLRPDRVFTFYQIGPSGVRTFLYAQNPSAPKGPDGLSDPSVPSVPAHMTIPGTPAAATDGDGGEPNEVTMRAVAAMTREALQIIKDTNTQLSEQMSQVRAQEAETRSYYETMMSGLQRELIDAKREIEEWKAKAAETEKLFAVRNEYQEQVNGLQDKITEQDQGMGLKDLMPLIPHFMPLINKLFESPKPPPAFDPYTGQPIYYGHPQAQPHPGFAPQPDNSAVPQPTQPMPQPIITPAQGPKGGR